MLRSQTVSIRNLRDERVQHCATVCEEFVKNLRSSNVYKRPKEDKKYKLTGSIVIGRVEKTQLPESIACLSGLRVCVRINCQANCRFTVNQSPFYSVRS